MTLAASRPDIPEQAQVGRNGKALRLGWVQRARPSQITLLMCLLVVVGGLVAGAGVIVKPEFGLGIAIAIGFGLLVMRQLEFGGLTLVALVPTLSGIRRGFPVPALKVTELLTVAVAGLVMLTLRRVHSRPWTRVEWTLLIYVFGYLGFGIYDARDLHASVSLSDYGTLLGPLQFFLAYRAVRLTLPTAQLQKKALRLLLYSSVPVALLGIAQEANVPAVRSLLANVTDSAGLSGQGAVASGFASFARATGPWPQWTLLAGYLAVILVLGIAILLEPACEVITRRRLNLILLIDGIGLLCTAEISATFGLLCALLLVAIWSRRLQEMLKAFGIAAVVFLVTVGPLLIGRVRQEYSKTTGTNSNSFVPETVAFRFQVWTTQYFPAIAHRPLDGYGIVVPPIIHWQYPESQYFLLLMRGGAPLLATYILLLSGLLSAGGIMARSRTDPLQRVTGRAVTAVAIILIPMGLVFPYFDDAGLPQALWVVVAIMMATVPARLPCTAVAVTAKMRRLLVEHRPSGPLVRD